MKESGHWWMCRVTHMNEPCHIWGSFQLAIHEPRLNESCLMRHVPCEEGMSHMNEICHVPYEEVMSHVKKACPIWMRYVMLQVKKACPIWRRNVPYESVESLMIVSCLYERVMSRINVSYSIGIRHVTCQGVSTDMSHVRESPPTCHMWGSLHLAIHQPQMCIYVYILSHMNESCHMWMSHVKCEWFISHMNESCPTREWGMSHIHESSQVWMFTSTRDKNASPDSFMGRVTYARIMCIEFCL